VFNGPHQDEDLIPVNPYWKDPDAEEDKGKDSEVKPNTCYGKLLQTLEDEGSNVKKSFKNLKLVMHRNGEPDPCGNADLNILETFQSIFKKVGLEDVDCPYSVRTQGSLTETLYRCFYSL
jgi:hypothetical protein